MAEVSQLLQDGVPLNLADGGFDFQAVEPLATRYIEVYRGANSLQFGSTTLGGALNFVSFTGYDASPLTARLDTAASSRFAPSSAPAWRSDRSTTTSA